MFSLAFSSKTKQHQPPRGPGTAGQDLYGGSGRGGTCGRGREGGREGGREDCPITDPPPHWLRNSAAPRLGLDASLICSYLKLLLFLFPFPPPPSLPPSLLAQGPDPARPCLRLRRARACHFRRYGAMTIEGEKEEGMDGGLLAFRQEDNSWFSQIPLLPSLPPSLPPSSPPLLNRDHGDPPQEAPPGLHHQL
jgi:hypothetical protein